MSASHTRIVWTPPIACAPHPPGAVVRPEIVPPVAVREAIASRSLEGGHVRAGSTAASRRRGREAAHVAAPARHAAVRCRRSRILAPSAARATPVGGRPCHSGGPSGRVAAAAKSPPSAADRREGPTAPGPPNPPERGQPRRGGAGARGDRHPLPAPVGGQFRSGPRSTGSNRSPPSAKYPQSVAAKADPTSTRQASMPNISVNSQFSARKTALTRERRGRVT